MVFSKKWVRNHQKFLLHFLIHIDVNLLCSKFEVIPTSIFKLQPLYEMNQNLKNTYGYSPWFFPKMGPKSPKIFITFSDTY